MVSGPHFKSSFILKNSNKQCSFCVGSTRYGPVDYIGTMYVKESDTSHYIGIVFGYQSNHKFYVIMWRRENINYANLNINAGIKGLQIKVTNVM